MGTPGVTVIIPCFNHGPFIADAVRSCLTQEDAEVRVITVDDGSTDPDTARACDACACERVLVIHQANTGLPGARNHGAREATARGGAWAAEFLVFLDADDWIEPSFVRKLHSALSSNDAPGPLSHAYCQERLVGLAQMVWAVPDFDPLLAMVTNLHPVTALVRRECFESAGGFDESMLEGYEDWDLWLRFIERGWRAVRVREPLFVWRRHSVTSMIVEAGQRHERLYRRLVENHRAMFTKHAADLLVIANRLLRQSDANWVDETGEAIVIRDLRRSGADLNQERSARESLQAQAAVLGAELDSARNALAGAERECVRRLESLRAEYESKPAVRFSRGLHRVIDSLPRPVGAGIRRLLLAAKKTAPQLRGRS